MDYPTETEIVTTLRPWIWGLWVLAIASFAMGIAVDLLAAESKAWNAFPRSGSLVLAVVLGVYFFLESREFLTGRPGNFIDSGNHYFPRSVLGPHYIALSILSTLIWGFGDLLVARGRRWFS